MCQAEADVQLVGVVGEMSKLEGQESQFSIYNLSPNAAPQIYSHLNGNNPDRTLDDAAPVLLTPVWLEFNCVGWSRRARGEKDHSPRTSGVVQCSPPASYARHVTSGCVIPDLYLHSDTVPIHMSHIFSLNLLCGSREPFWLNAKPIEQVFTLSVCLGGWQEI